MEGNDSESESAAGRRATPRITRHALDRWSERVGGVESPASALEQFMSRGRRRPRPRHWTTASAAPGTSFIYLSDQPGVCVVLRDGAAVTVLTRSLCRREAA